jgi:hypothetical protein
MASFTFSTLRTTRVMPQIFASHNCTTRSSTGTTAASGLRSSSGSGRCRSALHRSCRSASGVSTHSIRHVGPSRAPLAQCRKKPISYHM